MSRLSVALIVGAFLAAGVGLYVLVGQSSNVEARACEERCRSAGKRYLVAPAGTAGRAIDGTHNPTDGSAFCTCTTPLSGGVTSAEAK